METTQLDGSGPSLDSPPDSAIGSFASTRSSLTTIDSIKLRRILDGTQQRHAPTLPHNEEKKDRWDFLHDIRKRVLEYFQQESIIGPQHVLDVGTTTGIWAIDVADNYPGLIVVGLDNVLDLPLWVPPNLSWEFLEWDGEDWRDYRLAENFDAINISILDVHDWPKLIDNCYHALRPTGRIQCDGIVLHPQSDLFDLPKDSHLVTLCGLVRDAWRDRGVDLDAPYRWEEMLTARGFQDVQVQAFKVPCHVWPHCQELEKIGGMMAVWLIEELSASVQTLSDLPIETKSHHISNAWEEIKDPKRCQYFEL